MPRRRTPQPSSVVRTLLDLSNDGLEVIDAPTGRFLDVNQASCCELGYSRDELTAGMTLFDVQPSLTAASLRDLEARTKAGAAVVETVRRRRDGSTFPVEMAVRRSPDAPAQFLAAVRSLTEREQAERERQRFEVEQATRRHTEDALRASEDRLRTILEAEPECVKLMAADGTLVDMNPAGLAMIEAERLTDVVGQNVTHLVRPEHREAFTALTARVFAGETGSLQFEIEGLKGTRLWLEMHATPLRDRNERVIAALSVTRNITERVTADATRERLEEQLRQVQRMETIGQLSGAIAHDFNNLLTVIEGHASLLEADSALPYRLLEAVREISTSSQRASSLTRQLLTVSRRQPMELQDVDVNEIVEHMTRMLGRIVGAPIEVGVTLAGDPLLVRADAAMIDQVLLNLAVNARDAMPSGGRLTIDTGVEDVGQDALPSGIDLAAGSFARIRVSDTGTGIPRPVMSRIFEPFFTTKDVGRGTGLGLATADSIVRQHGGWINVESEVGTGSTFTLYLPRQKNLDRVPAPALHETAAVNGTETILLVEDELPLRALVRQVLSRAGYDVIEAGSGREAIDAWRDHRERVSLLLTDLVMPDGMNGLDLAGRLLEENHELKVIYTSGYSAEVAGYDGRLRKGVNFLAKPYRPAELLRTVRTHLDR